MEKANDTKETEWVSSARYGLGLHGPSKVYLHSRLMPER